MLTSTVARADFVGSGTTGPFSFPYRIFASSDLRVYKRDAAGIVTLLSLGVNYTVAGVQIALDPFGGGGSVTLTTALAVGEFLSIVRGTPNTQPTSFKDAGPYFASSHETAFDRLAMLIQNLQEQLNRSIHVNPSVQVNTELAMPSANQLIGWNNTATGLENKTPDLNQAVLPGNGRTVNSLTAYLANNAVFNVKDYGAVGNSVADDTNAVLAANAAAHANGRGKVYWPAGNYLIKDNIPITKNTIFHIGDGPLATLITFAPTATKSLFTVWTGIAPPGTILFYGAIKEIGVFGNNGQIKTAIEIIDTSNYLIENVYVDALTGGGGAGSVGLRYRGREQTVVRGCKFFADQPVWLSANPNFARDSLEDADHLHFQDLYLGAQKSTNYCVEADSDVNLSNVTFDGHNPWVLGKGGFHWDRNNGPPTAPTSHNLVFRGVRYEQAQDVTGYAFYIDGPPARIQSVTIADCYMAIEANGLFLRDIEVVSLTNVTYPASTATKPSGPKALDVDTTVLELHIWNCYWQTTSTASLGGIFQIWGTIVGTNRPLPFSALYHGGVEYADGFRINDTRHYSYTLTLVDGAAPTNLPFFNVFGATKVVRGTLTGASADNTVLEGGTVVVSPNGTAALINGTANFVVTNTAGKLCWLTNNPPQVRNRTGKDLVCVIDVTYAF